MGDNSKVENRPVLETVADMGGYCGWCGDAVEPGELIAWTSAGRVHEDSCLDAFAADTDNAALEMRARISQAT